MIIKRLQPARYLAGLVLAWGVVATLTAWVTNLVGLVACRLLLGLFPGVALYFTMSYGRRSIAYFFATSAFLGRRRRPGRLHRRRPRLAAPGAGSCSRRLALMQHGELGGARARNADELDWGRRAGSGFRDPTLWLFLRDAVLRQQQTCSTPSPVFLPTIIPRGSAASCWRGPWSTTRATASAPSRRACSRRSATPRAGVASSHMFEKQVRRPRFTRATAPPMGLSLLGLACIVALHCIFRWENGRRARGELDWMVEGRTEEKVMELGERSPYFRFTL
ncbi:hypothetical protein GGTG_02271 [Gaeumannomyces tritici R3-111a-1]|uniref:Major facilitator superfamily (MFS) profile domain-containing protein n=1 Tax=Gaeumannomyces tritici (strain R3-111a-1) TaxID=644352 RepID=J3NLW6_GAET3|nr:hypothetical protein GGTG_02271 [Gaeumannomyces tritici R3-111a-1]EJT82297.1 hypothetical protein GGTG_02271 [Gaeumannomyces tritici R3-111a-1]